jgi:hypothetical protein
MSPLDISAIGLQIVLPLSLIAWLIPVPMKSRLGFFLHALSIGLALTALLPVAVWMMPPWWVPCLFLALWLIVVISRAPGRPCRVPRHCCRGSAATRLASQRIAKGADPQKLLEELSREANLVFGHYNLEYELGLFEKSDEKA